MVNHGIFYYPPDVLMQGISEFDLISFYFRINKIPITIRSPFRRDEHPSFRIYSPDGKKILYKDFSNGESGGIFDLIGKLYNLNYNGTLKKISDDKKYMVNYDNQVGLSTYKGPAKLKKAGEYIIRSKKRNWEQKDFNYWKSYGIPENWILHSDIYPISFIIINNKITGSKQYIKADSLAYTFIERKDGIVSEKIYQPLNKNGMKWRSSHDKSIWDLWDKLPETGENLIITSSRKDALCIWANSGIPSTSPQSEACDPNPKVIEELKERFRNVYILYDNDFQNKINNGRNDGKKIADNFNLKQIEIPTLYKSKDISDLYRNFGHEMVYKTIKSLIKK